MKEITDEVIKLLENEKINNDFWYSQLGYAQSLIDGKELSENDLIYNFYEQGKYLWNKYKSKIRELLCDLEKGEPKFIVSEAIGGDIRTVLKTLITIIIAEFSIVVAIALPLACLVIKSQINKFCSLEWEG
jgi:hypothetical protein